MPASAWGDIRVQFSNRAFFCLFVCASFRATLLSTLIVKFISHKCYEQQCSYELTHDKTNKMAVPPAKTQIRSDAQSDQSLRCVLSG